MVATGNYPSARSLMDSDGPESGGPETEEHSDVE